MAPKKPYTSMFKITLKAGAATPAPPVGPILGQHGVNIQQFCVQFNEATQEHKAEGLSIPCVCYVFEDRTFQLEYKSPPASDLIKRALGLKSGSGKPNTEKVGTITATQLKEIYEMKKADMNANDAEAGAKIIAGSARQMGVQIDWTK